MKNAKRCAYAQIIRWRIRLGWALLALMLLYMVIAAEMGGGDSRVVTDLMDMVGDVIFFGGLVFILVRIAHNKRLLRDRARLREEEIRERDERNQYLHDKSGGAALDILLMLLLLSTVTAALFSKAAFCTAFPLLLAALAVKGGLYALYSRGQGKIGGV